MDMIYLLDLNLFGIDTRTIELGTECIFIFGLESWIGSWSSEHVVHKWVASCLLSLYRSPFLSLEFSCLRYSAISILRSSTEETCVISRGFMLSLLQTSGFVFLRFSLFGLTAALQSIAIA